MSEYLVLNLQAFSEIDTAGSVEMPASGGETGVTETAAASQDNRPLVNSRGNPLANVQYGIQEGSQAAADPQDGAGEDLEAGWKAAKEKYRSYYQNEMQTAVQNRVKNTKVSEERLEKLAPLLSGMYEKYGVEAGNIDALVNAYQNDDERLGEEALERGVSVEQLKEIKSLERDREELNRIRTQTAEDEQFRAHIAKLQQQAEAMKATVPGFNLREEMQNPDFVRLTSPQQGLSVDQAYYLVHRKELEAGARMASSQLARAQAANASRPTENGLIRSAAVDIRADPSKWSKADREEVRRRVARGEKIVL